MFIEEMKSACEAQLKEIGINRHPNGSGWFQSPNGKWLCSMLSEDPNSAVWIVMLDESEADFALFLGVGGRKFDGTQRKLDPTTDPTTFFALQEKSGS